MKRVGNVIEMRGYRVSKPAQGVKVTLNFDLRLPGLPENCPGYIWQNAARNLWITIQGKLRDLSEQAIRDLDGTVIDGSDLTKTFKAKKAKVDKVRKATSLLANMTAEEKAQFLSMLQGKDED
jgi:hypothetical protein